MARRSVTTCSICKVFHNATALDSRLRQLVGGAELALADEEQPYGQAVTGLAAGELGLDTQAKRLVMQVQDIAGLHRR